MSENHSIETSSSIEAQVRPIELRRYGKFTYPEGQTYEFELADEVGVDASYPELKIGDYRYLLQRLIGIEDRVEMIRATYYRRPPGKSRFYFAGQFALTAEREYWIALFAQALKTPWFRSLVDEATRLAGE